MQLDLEELTVSPGATHASRSRSPGTAMAIKMTAISGQRCLQLSNLSGPLGSLEKTLLVTFQWASTRCWLTWKAKGTPAGHTLFQLVPSMPRTDATEFGLWPTPVAKDDGKTPEAHMLMKSRMKGGPRHKPTSLQVMVKGVERGLWHTPQAHDAVPGDAARYKRHGTKHGGADLNDQVAAVMSELWPTPKASIRGDCPSERLRKSADQRSRLGGSLNPAWVEWLMGFPTGWTDLNP